MLAALRRLVRFLRMPGRATGRAALTPAQQFVLAQLAPGPAASLRDLADRTLTDPSSVSVVVARLVVLGLVERARDPRDQRRATLALTAAGRRAHARAPILPQVRIVAGLAALPPARRRAIASAMEALVRAAGAEAVPPRMFFEDDLPRARRRG